MGYRTFLKNTLPLYKTKGLYKELTPNWDDSEEFRRSRWSAKYTGPYTGDVTTKGGGEKGPLLEGFRHGEWLIDPSRCIEKLPPRNQLGSTL
ncbi:hypothetical protein OAK16_04505 [Verrucomicrobia bacterium]|nr:hypothetical protein [Verrucomicrobiota bacterium]